MFLYTVLIISDLHSLGHMLMAYGGTYIHGFKGINERHQRYNKNSTNFQNNLRILFIFSVSCDANKSIFVHPIAQSGEHRIVIQVLLVHWLIDVLILYFIFRRPLDQIYLETERLDLALN